MKIKTINIRNFRMLKDVTVDLEENTSLFIGKNNSGKTSFIVLLEKFLKNSRFDINDFPLSEHEKILGIADTNRELDISIKLGVEIEYSMEDDLTYISSFIRDLDPEKFTVNILLESKIDTAKLIKDLERIKEPEKRKRQIKKDLTKYIKAEYYIYDDFGNIDEENDRDELIKKDLQDIKKIINVEVIHAKRDVASSDDDSNRNYIISNLVSKYYNEKNKDNSFDEVNEKLLDLDDELEGGYHEFFEEFLKTSEIFLQGANLKVVSDLESNSILKHNSKILYGKGDLSLPENLKGLGYTNIIYLILNLEIKLLKFENNKKGINLFIIEEPEAHTHPQMQYVFIKQIKKKLKEWMDKNSTKLQTIITTHSSHIVDNCEFEDLRYFQVNNKESTIKNFVKELEVSYEEEFKNVGLAQMFKFIKQYLNVYSSELFFAEKIIMIEGITEKMLLPYFINKETPELNTQNITILEVGANAKAFGPLLKFLEIKTLIISDVDTVKKNGSHWSACEVTEGEATSNTTLTHFLGGKELERNSREYKTWYKKIINNELNQMRNLRVYYQTEENGYHARSFEDAFLNVNIDKVSAHIEELNGIKNVDELIAHTDPSKLYELTERILEKKSDFAASILYLGLSDKVKWNLPKYIKDGLLWLKK